MNAIGIRATPKIIYFAVVHQNENNNEILVISKLIIPLALSIPDKLNYVRKTVIDIINQYKVTTAGIKVTEGNAQKISIQRISIEAIIQELFSSCSVEKYFGGNISMISSLLEIPNDGTLKKMIKGEEIPKEIDFIKNLTETEREAVLSSLAALNL